MTRMTSKIVNLNIPELIVIFFRMKKAEEERLAAEKKAEEERLAAEKKAEEERIAAE